MRPLGDILSIVEVFCKKRKTSKSTCSALGAPKQTDQAQYFADVVKSLAGWQTYKKECPNDDWKRFSSHEIHRTASYRQTNQTRESTWVTSSTNCNGQRWKIITADVLETESLKPSEVKIYQANCANRWEKGNIQTTSVPTRTHKNRTAKLDTQLGKELGNAAYKRTYRWREKESFKKIENQTNWRTHCSSITTSWISSGRDSQRTWTTESLWRQPQAGRAESKPILIIVVSRGWLVDELVGGQIVAMERKINPRLLPTNQKLECLWWSAKGGHQSGEWKYPHRTKAVRNVGGKKDASQKWLRLLVYILAVTPGSSLGPKATSARTSGESSGVHWDHLTQSVVKQPVAWCGIQNTVRTASNWNWRQCPLETGPESTKRICKHHTAPRALHTRKHFLACNSRSWTSPSTFMCVRIKNNHSSFSCVMSHSHSLWSDPAMSCSSAHSLSTLTFSQWRITTRSTDRKTVGSIGHTKSSCKWWTQRHCWVEQYRPYSCSPTIKDSKFLLSVQFRWGRHNYACVFGSRWETKHRNAGFTAVHAEERSKGSTCNNLSLHSRTFYVKLISPSKRRETGCDVLTRTEIE